VAGTFCRGLDSGVYNKLQIVMKHTYFLTAIDAMFCLRQMHVISRLEPYLNDRLGWSEIMGSEYTADTSAFNTVVC